MRVGNLLDSFLSSRKSSTANVDKYPIRRWTNFLRSKGLGVTTATEHHARQFLALERQRYGIKSNGRTDLKLCNSTIYRVMCSLSAWHSYLVRVKVCTENPFTEVIQSLRRPIPNEREEYRLITDDEVRRLLEMPARNALEIRNKALIVVLLAGGLRLSEALNLRLGDIGESSKGTVFLRLRETKSGKPEIQALPEWSYKTLFRLLDLRKMYDDSPDAVVFPHLSWPDLQFENLPLTRSYANRLFQKICRELNIENVSAHCTRGTAITRLLTQGLDHRSVMEFSRHSSVRMVELYDKRRYGVDESPAKKLKW